MMAELEGRMQVEDEELREMIDSAVLKEAEETYLTLKARLRLKKELFDSFRRLDILQELVDDPEITEIMVNGTDHVFVEKGGRISRSERTFDSAEQLEDLIQQIVSRVNRTVNLSSPIADARLEDGSRVHVVLAPVAIDGPVLTIRKFPEPITMDKLIGLGSITREGAQFLKTAVRAGYNIFVSGGTGSGKTTFLNALSEFIPEDERIITIEDSAELQIRHIPNLVRLETRVENRDGSREISVRDLIKASLRMRPDRILVGEVRGAEALEMLQAMNTGHDGSVSTGHGNSPKDMITRLETMVLMAADLPLAAVRNQIASAVELMVHVGRLRDKSRKVLEISEVTGCEEGQVMLEPIFTFREREGKDRKRVEGTLEKVGELRRREKLRAAGLDK
ncbi:CpaF family protein [uncultured Clostridium sp.]|uniref:CpaF family protein n=1 Tax=uncultured Clostridium sp. TaxID=59620 RepID=UPI00345788F7